MVGDKKKFSVTTRRTLEKHHPGKKYFRTWHYTTQNSPMRVLFYLFTINLAGIITEQK